MPDLGFKEETRHISFFFPIELSGFIHSEGMQKLKILLT